MLTERMMEDAIAANPQKYLGEEGLELLARQYRIGSYIFDLLFRDRHGAKLIVEIQRGTLDRNHTYKIIDYYDEYKERHPEEFVELMVVANKIPPERQRRLTSYGIEFREIPESAFLDETEGQRPCAFGPAAGEVQKDAAMADHSDSPRTPSTPDSTSEPAPGAKSQEQAMHERFWQLFLDEMRSRPSDLFHGRVPSRRRCLHGQICRNVYLSVPTTAHEAWTEVCIQRSEEESAAIFEALREQKSTIEGRFGEGLAWDPVPGRNRCKIMTRRLKLGYADTDRWKNELIPQLVDLVLRFWEAIGTEYKEVLRRFP